MNSDLDSCLGKTEFFEVNIRYELCKVNNMSIKSNKSSEL